MITEELTAEQYKEVLFKTALAKSIIANQNALNSNDILKGTEFYKGKVKELGSQLNTILINAEAKEFSKCFKTDSKAVSDIYSKINEANKLLCRCVMTDYDDVILVLKALAKNRDAIVGIAKKYTNINTKLYE